MKTQFFRATWGMDAASLEESFQKIKHGGFDGVEMSVPDDLNTAAHAGKVLAQLSLPVVAHQWTQGSTAAEHRASFEKQFERTLALNPLHVNSHTGRDYFSLADNLAIFDHAAKVEASAKIPIFHETHRGRALFSLPSAIAILQARPQLKLTADFSHWCCVHESLLEDQHPHLELAINRSFYIHARVGHSQSAQITDPRDPAWHPAMAAHLSWWKKILALRSAEGCSLFSICPEFGPPPYMVVQPRSHQPIADLWQVNCFMRDWLKEQL